MPIFGSFAASGLASKLLGAAKAAFAKILLSTNTGYSTALTSDPGAWTSVSNSDTPSRAVSYAYGNGVYVVASNVGYGNPTPYVMYGSSADGSVENITWNSVSGLDSADSSSVAFIPELGKFIIRGTGTTTYTGNGIYVSTNGATWTEYTSALTSSTNGANATYINGKVFLASSGNRLMDTSTDGVTWTVSGTKSGPLFYNAPTGFNYFNGYFWTVNIADSYSPGAGIPQGYIRYSTDLVTWSNGLLPGMVVENYYGNTVQVQGSRIIVGGQSSIYTSTNGTTWTSVSMPNGYNMNSPIAYGNSRWAVVVTVNMGQGFYVNYSTNATSFTQGTNIGFGGAVSYGNDSAGQPIQPNWQYLVYGTEFVLSGSYQDTSNYNMYACTMKSTDAVTWTNFVKHNTYANSYFKLSYAGSKYLMGSTGSGDITKAIAASTNGVTWTYSAHPDSNGTQANLSAVNNTFILQGSPSTVIYSSTNGTTWTSSDTQQTGYWNIWTYGAGKYVTNKPSSTDVIQSTDLVTWGGTTYTGAYISDTMYSGGMYSATVALLGSYRSTDGTTWSSVSGSAMANSGGIAYGNNLFLHVQQYGTVSTSTDGLTWSQTASLNPYLAGPSFIDGKFYVHDSFYGSSGYYSTDGVTWTSFSLPSGFSAFAPFIGKP